MAATMERKDSASGPALPRLGWKISEAAASIGVSERFLWGEISRGKLRVTRIGNKTTRITADDLAAYLEAGKGAR